MSLRHETRLYPPIAMTTIVIACAAALVATALAVTVFLLGRRSRGATRGQAAARSPPSSTSGWQAMVRDLSEALERAQAENRRTPRCSASSAARSTSTRCSRARSTRRQRSRASTPPSISIAVEGGEPLVAAVGLGGVPPAGDDLRPAGRDRSRASIAVEYDYGPSDEAVEGGPIRAALAVPLVSEGEQLGYLDRVLPQRQGGVRRVERRRARGARAPRRPGDRQRAPLPRGAPARRPRRADGAAQPPLLPRDARARGRAGAPLQPQPRARRLRPRRLQGDQRPDRAPRRRRRARRGRRARPRRRPHRRRRLPRRRRRVRGDPARVVRHRRGSALQAARARRSRRARSARRAGCTSPPASPS